MALILITGDIEVIEVSDYVMGRQLSLKHMQ
jgi:hypothetical protein